MYLINRILLSACTLLVSIAVVPVAAQTTIPLRINYDLVAPWDDATSRPYDEVTAVVADRERAERLRRAAAADNFREHSSPSFRRYRNLVPGDDPAGEGKKFVATRDAFGANVGRQAVGPLTGQIIYCSAGHGWTNDNTSTSLWYTQRPVTHGIVEDFGNLDQMNLYANICFRAGATVVPMRPIGFQHVERVIDNDSAQAGFYGQWADSSSTASFGFAGAKVPYRFSRAAAEESAVARFRPVIPVTDLYPVYCWARAGVDRVVQTYRVVHAGGVNEVDVDHRRVGNGWVYIGSYTFRAGEAGYVEVTNQVRDAEQVAHGGVVIADAIRFGNGMGDVNRGGGISGYPREEEASRYWVERALPADAPPVYDAFTDRGDQSNNVGSAPRYAALMNREAEAGFFDRVFMSFHSNAVGGRGVMGLYNAHAVLRPDHQIELAKIVAEELNAEMTSAGLTLETGWTVRAQRTQAHINFGEIRRDYINNEMSATINEVAFHDNPEDAALLRRLSIRKEIAEASYRATVRYFKEVGQKPLDYYSPPLPPTLLYARQGYTSGTLELGWQASEQDPLSSPTELITYKIYRSKDGIAFDHGSDVGTGTSYVVEDVEEQAPLYFRVTAVSRGGESDPSAVLGASRSTGPRVLVVQGVSTVSDDAVLTQSEEANLGGPTRPGGKFARLVPRLMNNGEQVRAIGSGVRWLRRGFDSLELSQISAETSFTRYAAVAIMLGRNKVAEDITTTDMLRHLHDYVTTGGHLLISGGCLAECDTLTTGALERWGEFARSVLQTSFSQQTSMTRLLKSGDRELTTVTLQIGNRSLRYFDPRPTEVLAPEDAGRPVLAYDNRRGAAAVATLKDQLIQTVMIGFPLEELENREEQAVLVAQVLLAMGMEQAAQQRADVNDDNAVEEAKAVAEELATTHTESAAKVDPDSVEKPG